MSVPECHRSALLNIITDPAGATIFTSSGCGPIPDPNASRSIGGSLIRCEPGMTRSGPLSGVKAVIHHMAEVGIPPADVGQRVTIRWRPPELEGSSKWMTDVLGILEEADDQFFKVRRGTFTSVKELTVAIGTFIDHWNDHPRPFTWTKDADEILRKINRAKTKTNSLTHH